MALTEEELVEGCRLHKRKIQEQLYRLYAGEMFRVCLAYEPDKDAAKDILQNSFLKVFRSIDSYTGKGSLKAWIRRIITNTAIDFYRQKKSIGTLISLDELQEYNQPVAQESDPHFYDDLITEVDKLPDGARLVFNLYALEGYGHKEIAEKLEVSEGTSKSQLNRARKILNERLRNVK